MIATPALPIWLLVLLFLVLGGFTIWRLALSRGTGTTLNWSLRVVMVILLLVIAIRPAIPGSGTRPKAVGGLEVYFVVDTTSSMAAEDWGSAQPRLDGVKADIADIAKKLPGAEFSLVSFDATTLQRVPLTSDATALDSASSVLTQEVTTYSSGSGIDQPVAFMSTLLADARKSHPEHRRVLFYLGDGEQTRATPPGSFASLKPLISGGQVLGYGTDAGGKMKEFTGYPPKDDNGDGKPDQQPGYIQDTTVTPPVDAISKIDEGNLKTIAGQLGVGYLHRESGAPVDPAIAGISVGAVSVQPGRMNGPFEFYWIVAIPLGLLVLREFALILGALLELRTTQRRSS